MAGNCFLLILLAVVVALPVTAQQADKDPRPDGTRRRIVPKSGQGSGDQPGPEFQNARRAIEALTPEQRKRFEENFARWANLSTEEKKTLRGRDELRRKVIRDELEAAMQELGLPLEGERREQFMQRYAEERRKIEETLRKELIEKRKPMLRELISRLKNEFATPAAPAPVPAVPPAAATPATAP